jgi:hypothetical protein
MIADVTQDLIVRVVPVNTPHKTNAFSEQLGYYNAYVSHDEHQIEVAQSEWHRGIVHSGAGYGSHSTARIAVLNAVDDYIEKFGPLCIADTDNVA